MDNYIDIELKPDAKMHENVLLNKVYTKFHKRLYDLSSSDIGVSFPQYNIMLGKILRIHGSKQQLHEIQKDNWLGGMAGYCNVSDIMQTPEGIKYRCVSRIQSTMSPAKLRRLVKRKSIKPDEVKQYRANMFKKGLDNPYVELESGSNGQMHRRYFSFGKLQANPISGKFDQFGLSKTATVPWF